MKVKIKLLDERAKIPTYAQPGDAGMDVYALTAFNLGAGQVKNLPLGFALEFPFGWMAKMADKGSLAKRGVHVFGGVYDAGYRGEYNVFLYNSSRRTIKFETGDKLAQLIFYPIARVDIVKAIHLSKSKRGQGRFGSTGRK